MPQRAFKVIFYNFKLKLVALVISLGIWFYAKSQITDEATFRATIKISPPSGHTVLYQSDTVARATIAAPRSLLDRLRSELSQSFQLTRNLSDEDVSKGWATLKIDSSWMKPGISEREYVQITLRDVSPQEVRVLSNPIRERVVPVVVRTSGEPATGFRLAEPPSCSPSQVKVRGAAMAVDALKSLATNNIDLYDRRESVHRPIALETEAEVALDNGEHVIVPLDVQPSTCVASILVVGEEERDQTFEGVRVMLLTPPGFRYAARLSEDKVSVVVRASPANLRRLKPESIRAFVDLEKLSRESIEPGGTRPYKEKVEVSLPEDVTYSMAQAQPGQATLLLKNPAQ
jgi:hypothetical protein